jgi:hypothetical protein
LIIRDALVPICHLLLACRFDFSKLALSGVSVIRIVPLVNIFGKSNSSLRNHFSSTNAGYESISFFPPNMYRRSGCPCRLKYFAPEFFSIKCQIIGHISLPLRIRHHPRSRQPMSQNAGQLGFEPRTYSYHCLWLRRLGAFTSSAALSMVHSTFLSKRK